MQSPRKSTVGKYRLFNNSPSAVMGGGKKICKVGGNLQSTNRQTVIFFSRYRLSPKDQTARQSGSESSIGKGRARRRKPKINQEEQSEKEGITNKRCLLLLQQSRQHDQNTTYAYKQIPTRTNEKAKVAYKRAPKSLVDCLCVLCAYLYTLVAVVGIWNGRTGLMCWHGCSPVDETLGSSLRF